MSGPTWTPMHGGQPKTGDRVATPHDCPACWEPLTGPTVTSDGATIHAACADEREWRPDKEDR